MKYLIVIATLTISCAHVEKVDPSAQVYAVRCINAMERGDMQGAELVCRLCVEADYSIAPCHNGLGVSVMDEREFRIAIKLDDRYPQPHNNLGVLAYLQGKLETAVKHFENALKLSADYIEAMQNMAKTQLALGNSTAAEKYFRKCLLIDEENVTCKGGLADVTKTEERD